MKQEGYGLVALIPVRGGSKSIPLKNIKPIHGRPLIYWTVAAAVETSGIDQIFISTDSEAIKNTVLGFGFSNVQVIDRSPETASDTASTESAMMEFALNYEFQDLMLIQATSPLLDAGALREGVALYQSKRYDSVLSTVRQKRFIWQEAQEGVTPVNYDPLARPRRQEFQGYLVENGAFYITGREAFLETGCRISGTIGTVEMDEMTYFEIDEPGDWVIIEEFLRRKYPSSGYDLSKIKMVVTDVDGVLTDGGMYYSEQGDELKRFNTKDGMGFGLLKKHGILTGIITGEGVNLVTRRAFKVQADEVHLGIKDKLPVLDEILSRYGLGREEVAYLGDDINDLEVIKAVGFGCTVADGVDCVKHHADYITKAKGGEGAFREVVQMILGSNEALI